LRRRPTWATALDQPVFTLLRAPPCRLVDLLLSGPRTPEGAGGPLCRAHGRLPSVSCAAATASLPGV